MNCWEYMDCPREIRDVCPAYPKNGRDCWKMPNTMCAGGRYRLSTLAEKVSFCRICEFYKLYANRPMVPPRPEDEDLGDGAPLTAMPE